MKKRKVIIAVVNEKGGCGKTTVATNLAVEFAVNGASAALLDADSQTSSGEWANMRPGDVTPVDTTVLRMKKDADGKESKLRNVAPELQKNHDVVIIDAGGRLHETAFSAVRMADLTLIPLIPSKADLASTANFLDSVVYEISALKEVNVGIVVNCWRETVLHRQAYEQIKELGLPVLETKLGSRIAYQDAYARGLGVSEYDRGTAALEVAKLYEEIVAGLAVADKKK